MCEMGSGLSEIVEVSGGCRAGGCGGGEFASRKDKTIRSVLFWMRGGGGRSDTRRNPTAVNNLAAERGIEWFRNHVITKVPFPHPGVMRDVYPGFLQLSGFITMNLDRHTDAHKALFNNLVKGDGDMVDKHREFYDEYLAVMDLTAESYLQTVHAVFVKHPLPNAHLP